MFPIGVLLIFIYAVPLILILLMAIPAARFTRKKEEGNTTSILQRKTDYRYLLKIFSIITILFLLVGIVGYLSVPYAIYFGLMRVPIESIVNLDGILYTIPEEEKADIYISIIGGLTGAGRTDTPFRNAYIVCGEKLSEQTKKEIEEYFIKYSINIEWISDRKEAPREDCCTGEIIDGVLIDLSDIRFPAENKAYVVVYTALSGAMVSEFITYLEKIDGKWTFVGDRIYTFIS